MGLLSWLNRGNGVTAAAANEAGRSPGRLDEPPPQGSAAALLKSAHS